jgi:hypothetical protein
VVGAGPAGLGASLAAASTGAQVILAEQYGFAGGSATAALVYPFMSFHTSDNRPDPHHPAAPLFPADHGSGVPLIAGGILRRLLNRLIDVGGALPPSPRTGYVVPFEPELLKCVSLDLLDDAGVNILFHSFASSIIILESLPAVVFETKSGPLVIRARTVVDCTGDGDVAALAGAPFSLGRKSDSRTQPMTLYFRLGDVNLDEFARFVKENPGEWHGVKGLRKHIAEWMKSGNPPLPCDDILMFGGIEPDEVFVNSTRVGRLSGIDARDLTKAEMNGRRQMRVVVEFLKKTIPGFQHAQIVGTGTHIGVRETRRITGDYILTREDVLQARKFDDAIAHCAYPIDIHDPHSGATTLTRLPPGEHYDIPLRCLLPLTLDRFMVAGRCISGTHEAHASYRTIPTSIATGQAAGVCAGLAALGGVPVRQISVDEVRRGMERLD